MVARLAASAAGGKMAKTLALSYGAPSAARGIAIFFDTQFEVMQASSNTMVAQSGRVLQAAAYGYGIGYITPVAIMAAGQLILGNPLSAIGTVGSAAILSNPIAATCAAAGALFYGYGALTNEERAVLIESIADGLGVGRQLIASIIDFVIGEMKKALDSDTLAELKAAVAEYAALLGCSIADITRALMDRVHVGLGHAYDGAVYIGQGASEALAVVAASGTAIAGKARDQIAGLRSAKDAPDEPLALAADDPDKTAS